MALCSRLKIPSLALALSLVAFSVRAGEIQPVSTPECDLRFTGEIEPGDAEKMYAALERFDNAERNPGRRLLWKEVDTGQTIPRLCLNSPGGDFSEAIQFVTLALKKRSFGTVLERDAECLSACAIVFLSGNVRELDGYFETYRQMHVTAHLGYHAPFLPTDAQTNDQVLIKSSYLAGIKAVAALLAFDKDFFPKSLLQRMLEKDPDQMFVLERIWEAGIWRIGLLGYVEPQAATESDLFTACMNEQMFKVYRENGEAPSDDILKSYASATNDDEPVLKSVKLSAGLNNRTFEHFGAEAADKCLLYLFADDQLRPVTLETWIAETTEAENRKPAFLTTSYRGVPLRRDTYFTPLWQLYGPLTRLNDIAAPRDGEPAGVVVIPQDVNAH